MEEKMRFFRFILAIMAIFIVVCAASKFWSAYDAKVTIIAEDTAADDTASDDYYYDEITDYA